jgi:hypothetical protein
VKQEKRSHSTRRCQCTEATGDGIAGPKNGAADHSVAFEPPSGPPKCGLLPRKSRVRADDSALQYYEVDELEVTVVPLAAFENEAFASSLASPVLSISMEPLK